MPGEFEADEHAHDNHAAVLALRNLAEGDLGPDAEEGVWWIEDDLLIGYCVTYAQIRGVASHQGYATAARVIVEALDRT